MAQILDKQGLQHYANKMCNADNRKVGSKNLPTALNDIDTAIDGFKTLFESEYGSALNMKLENNENVFSVGTGTNIDKRSEVENSFTDVELSGNSLVNLFKNFEEKSVNRVTEGENIQLVAFVNPCQCNLIEGEVYTCLLEINNLGDPVKSIYFEYYCEQGWGAGLSYNITLPEGKTHFKKSFTFKSGLGQMNKLFFGTTSSEIQTINLRAGNIMLLKGDWTNKPVPQYFEGLKSVGEKEDGNHKISISSIGNNLIDFKNPIKNVLSYAMGFPLETTQTLSSLGSKYKLLDNGFYFESPNNSHNQGVGFYVKCKKNTNYILSCMVDFKNAPAIKCQGVYSNEIPINNYISRALLISKEKISTSDFSVTFNSQNYDYLLFYFGGS